MDGKPASSADRRWREIAAGSEEDVDLAEAALTVAAEAYPELDIPQYLARLDELAGTLRQRLRADISATDTLIALNHYLFDELGFSGNAADYYDARNSYLNEVLDRRLGIPITLSIVYIEVGRRLGLALRGVSFPGHFLVKCTVRDGAVVLDPYSRGVSLSIDDLRHRALAMQAGMGEAGDDDLRRLLVSASKKEILARVLRNLKAIHLQKGELERALSTAVRIIELNPRAAEEYRDRASIYLELECFRAALLDYERYLELRPRAGDAEAVKEKVADLQRLASRLN